MAEEDISHDSPLLAPPPHLVEIANQELGETDEVRASALLKMHELINNYPQKHPDAPCSFRRRDNRFLLAFLRQKKFEADRAFEKFLNFSKFVDAHEFAQAELDFDLILKICSTEAMQLLHPAEGDHDVKGRILLTVLMEKMMEILAPKEENGDVKVTFEEFEKAQFYFNVATCYVPEIQIVGFSVLEDMTGFSLSVGKKMNSQMKGHLHLMQYCYPFRINRIVMINCPWYFDIAWKIFRPFLTQKMLDRFTIVDSYESLYKIFPKEILSKEFKGDIDSTSGAVVDMLKKSYPFFKK